MKTIITVILSIFLSLIAVNLHLSQNPISQFSGGELPAVIQPKLGATGLQEIYSSDYKDKRPEDIKYPIETDSKTNLNVPIYTSATTTDYKTIPARKVVKFDTEYLSQGLCIMMKDSDGAGVSYLSVNNGVLTVSVASCE